MRKLILTPAECGDLVPHWPEFSPEKIERLVRMTTRRSRFDHSREVMSPIPIIIAPEDNYVVNGKHRAIIAFLRGFPLEAFGVSSVNDIRNHTPTKAYGETGLDGVVDSYVRRATYIGNCKLNGVHNIADLAQKVRASSQYAF